MGLLAPVVVSASFPVEEFRHERVRLVHAGHLSGPLIAEHLHAAQSVVVAVCSIGPDVEEAASECFAADPAMSLALDAFGSAAVDLLGTDDVPACGREGRSRGAADHRPAEPGPCGLACG